MDVWHPYVSSRLLPCTLSYKVVAVLKGYFVINALLLRDSSGPFELVAPPFLNYKNILT